MMVDAQAAKNNAAIMAQLFDVDIDTNLDMESSSDYGTTAVSVDMPFETKCETVKSIMQPDPDADQFVAPSETIQAVEQMKKTDSPMPVAKETTKKTTAKGKKSKEVTVPVTSNADVPFEIDSADSLDAPVSNVVAATPVVASSSVAVDSNNPLGLSGYVLESYNALIAKYPQFRIHSSDQSFKDFYIRKIQIVSSLLSKFPMLNTSQMRQEVRGTDLNHNLGESEINPDTIAQKLDNTYKCRTRVVYLLSETHAQHHAWRKCSEMLASKLWSDHESRGAHKRESLVLDHMSEIAMYVEEMEGFLQSAGAIDGLLKAAADSLSRQLSCIQIKQSSGLAAGNKPHIKTIKNNDFNVEHLDGLDDGTVIGGGLKTGSITHDWGNKGEDPDDSMLNIA